MADDTTLRQLLRALESINGNLIGISSDISEIRQGILGNILNMDHVQDGTLKMLRTIEMRLRDIEKRL